MKKLILLLSVAALSAQMGVFAGVKAWEGELTLPSYKLDAPESTPIFDCDWSYQRARRSVYPYPLNDNMTRTREIKSYKALYLDDRKFRNYLSYLSHKKVCRRFLAKYKSLHIHSQDREPCKT